MSITPLVSEKDLTLYNADCMVVMPTLQPESVDMICCDLPYGTTGNVWDEMLPLGPMWNNFRRLIKPQGAIVLTASQPFTSKLVMSAADIFKYEWVWIKSRPTGHVQAKNKPMKRHENVLVFSPGTTVHASQSEMRMHYYPRITRHDGKVFKPSARQSPTVMGHRSTDKDKPPMIEQDGAGYPDSVLNFASEGKVVHTTQKPVPLMRELILSYTKPGDVVFDCCMGSGTTGVAAIGAARRFVGIELDPQYARIAADRIAGARSPLDRYRQAPVRRERVRLR